MKNRPLLSCPLCNRIDCLELPDENRYNKVFPDGEGVVDMRCFRCNIKVSEYPEKGVSYDEAVDRLVTKWNSIKR